MQRVLTKRRGSQRGVAIVEGALVLLASLTLLIFILDMGRYMLIQEYIAQRAWQTARRAAVNNWTATQARNYFVYNTADTQTRSEPGRLGLTPDHVTYSLLGVAGTPNHRVQVRVSGVQAFLFVPRLSGARALPTVVATVPAQSLGANN